MMCLAVKADQTTQNPEIDPRYRVVAYRGVDLDA